MHVSYFSGEILIVDYLMFIANNLSGMCLNIMKILLYTVTKPTTLASIEIILTMLLKSFDRFVFKLEFLQFRLGDTKVHKLQRHPQTRTH